jgi:hypothetical protein
MAGPSPKLQGLLARGQKAHIAAQRVRRGFCHDQMCDVDGVERAAEQRPRPPGHAAQGVEGVDGVAVESAVAGQTRSSAVALG